MEDSGEVVKLIREYPTSIKLILDNLNLNSASSGIASESYVPPAKRLKLVDESSDAESMEERLENLFPPAEEHAGETVNIDGIQLPIIGESSVSNLILLDSTISNLNGLALGVATKKPVCLCGPVGCGKTALVQHLAAITGHTSSNRFYRVQLGEEMDSKLLLGSYKCTDVPGEFVWQPGVLTKAVIGGDWILFEDIDSATNDVVTLLVSLIERNSLNVPSYRDNIVPASGFQLFFTQRLINSVSGYFQSNSATAELLRKHWLPLNIEPLNRQELEKLIRIKYPPLSTIAQRMVDVFLLFSFGSHARDTSEDDRLSTKNTNIFGARERLTSTRDLLKWCSRSVPGYNVTSKPTLLNVIQNAIDIFCCNVSVEGTRMKLAKKLTCHLGETEAKAEHFCQKHKPTINVDKHRCIAGRATLARRPSDIVNPAEMGSKMYFAETRLSCCLMEQVAYCLFLNEPVLLVGETGTGKTSTLQLLAKYTSNTLVVLNMNQQSDSTDLLGGYKPVDVKYVISALRNEFEELFRLAFNVTQNTTFLNHISNCFNQRNWGTLIKLMKHVKDTVMRKESAKYRDQFPAWSNFGDKLERLALQLKHDRALAFSFIEGALIRAVRQGYWVLLDEINLASAETLQCLSGLLEENGTLSLYEKGELEPVNRHENFRLMAAMNPATDVGKKQLPPGIRNRFTEFFVNELTDKGDLIKLVGCYLRELESGKIEAIAKFYMKIKGIEPEGKKPEWADSLNDGTGHKPHYSLRTLCRALSIVATNPCRNILRSLYEAFCLSFLTQLDLASRVKVEILIISYIILGSEYSAKDTIITAREKIKHIIRSSIPEPEPLNSHLCFQGYWLMKGSNEVEVSEKYILTESVTENLKDLVRIVSMSNHPVLLQGDTSVGKTSLISYLASASGNKCLRINNHEHTDLQEYVGTYSADEDTGQLVFKEGVLVEAMRHGYWIILDELNLAPSDVLEALNRVLDDNRELYIPETQTLVKANPKFRLFATQNPPGLYGGRKMLSRAFRNRFIELHFSEIPSTELEYILHKRCEMPPSYTKKMVAVMKELQANRRASAAFAGKQGFITLRDLFRWGERYRLSSSLLTEELYDWDQHIADEGYLILAGRVRKAEEADIVVKALEKHIKRKVDIDRLFTLSNETSAVTRPILEAITTNSVRGFEHIVWTSNLRRMAVLVGKALEFQEPILLVGETGCGKTTICQFLSALREQKLLIINCHQHTESSDFLGGLRPCRQHSENESKLFEWVDGPLIEAMKNGYLFLADEISLTDDSVLERLNSLLEPERTLLLSEKSNSDSHLGEVITACPGFYFLSTMNPGGDYGKKELSPALRNRLTEIWCENCSSRNDLMAIVEHNIKEGLSFGNQEDGTSGVGKGILNFIEWFERQNLSRRVTWSVRDILLWVKFINKTVDEQKEFMSPTSYTYTKLSLNEAYVHGAHLVFLDGLGTGLTGNYKEKQIKSMKEEASTFLKQQIELLCNKAYDDSVDSKSVLIPQDYGYVGYHPFYIKKGPSSPDDSRKHIESTTTKENFVRLFRALQLAGRAVLLEGSPGVGKTSMIETLAANHGFPLTRINLSEQTDISDLFGADLPVDGAEGGVFAWRDGPFLKALKEGHWILLDELNLASQSVLEGLNAVLDHRGELFIPELSRTFIINSSSTRLFACQNPVRQGGGRKGLPASFLNRFTKVYVEPLNHEDISYIVNKLHPDLGADTIDRMVNFNSILANECGVKWALRGAPWEMNLRDMLRWCEVMKKFDDGEGLNPGRFVELVYADRMRSKEDRRKVLQVYQKEFGVDRFASVSDLPFCASSEDVIFGDIPISRTRKLRGNEKKIAVYDKNMNLILRHQVRALRSLAVCLEMNWFVILVGSSGSGKTKIVQTMAQICNEELDVLSVNSAMDTMDILGGFEQVDYNRHLECLSVRIERILLSTLQILASQPETDDHIAQLLEKWKTFKNIGRWTFRDQSKELTTLAAETELFKKRLLTLSQLVQLLISLNSAEQKLTEIKEKLETLCNNVENNGSLNCGGRFEWVDSVLIKCVLEGRWLLVENVNLCTPAILDRLNGLLEPNGELLLGEKGVDSNGALLTVKPHPNFRLFFTMNPQRGEISRAMRNRGVEIFVEPIDEDLDRTVLDLMAILHSNELQPHSAISSLCNVHFAVKNLNIGLDEPSISHLIHACFLLVQHSRHKNQSVQESMRLVLNDVYVKSRSLSYEQREIVSACIDNELTWQTCPLADLPPFHRTHTTNRTQRSISADRHQVEGALPLLFAYLVANNYDGAKLDEILFSRIPLSDEFRKLFQLEELEHRNLLTYSVLSYYDRASISDAVDRHSYLTQIVNHHSGKLNTSDLSYVASVSECLHNLIAKSAGNTNNWPWDLRRLSAANLKMSIDRVACDKLSLLMNYELTKYRNFRLDCVRPKDEENMDVNLSDYSLACVSGHIPVGDALENCLAHDYNTIVSLIDKHNGELLRSSGASLFTDEYETLMKIILACGRLNNVGNIAFFSRSTGEANEILVNYLRLQMAWLHKFVRDLIAPNTEEMTVEMMDVGIKSTIDEISNLLEEYIDSPLDAFVSYAKKLMKYMLNLECSGLIELIMRDSRDEEFSSWIFQSARSVDKYTELRNYLCQIFVVNDPINNEPEEKSAARTETSTSVGEDDLSPASNSEESDPKVTYAQYKYPLEIIPMFECFLLKLESLHKNVVQTNIAHENRDLDACKNLMSMINSQTPSIVRNAILPPSSYAYALEKASIENNFNVEWFILLAKHARSFSTFTYRSYLELREPKEQRNVARLHSKTVSPFHYPLLTVFGNEFMYNLRDEKLTIVPEFYKPSLKIIRNHQIMLNQLKELLWKNSAFLSHNSSSFVLNEKENAVAHYHYLISSMQKVLPRDANDSSHREKQFTHELRNFVAKKSRAKDALSKTVDELINVIEKDLHELRGLAGEIEKFEISDENCRLWAKIGKCWTLMGIVQLRLFSVLESVDPVLKKQLKEMNYRDDLEFTRCRLVVENLSKTFNGGGCFPYRTMFEKWREDLEEKLDAMQNEVVERNKPENYSKIMKRVMQFKNKVGSTDIILKLCSKVFQRLEAPPQTIDFDTKVESETQFMIKECEGFLVSCDAFVKGLTSDFSEYQDIVMPIVYSVSMVNYGISVLSSCLHKWLALYQTSRLMSAQDSCTVQMMCARLCSFPLVVTNAADLVEIILSDTLIPALANDRANVSGLIVRLTKSSLKELFSILSVYEKCNSAARFQIWGQIQCLLDRVVCLWKKQEEEREQRKQEEDSLYEFRTRTMGETLSEEEENRRRKKDFFAPSLERDFDSDITIGDDDSENIESEEGKKKPEIYITPEEMNEICSLHSDLSKSFTYTNWICSPATSSEALRASIVSSFVDRYGVFAALLDKYSVALDEIADTISLPGMLLVANEARKMNATPNQLSDFYHTPDVKQVALFHPLLVRIRSHTEALLKQWEDHPTLKGLVIVIDRIMSFEITSPVSRFLTGADVLLKKMYDWNIVAHSGISFSTLYEELTGLIFKWRKMEISHWKKALDHLAMQMKQNVSKWWFHMYAICSQYEEDNSTMTIVDFVTVCQKYAETATLGEFDSKLNLFYVFHCHYANQRPQTGRLKEICAALWNLYVYYGQFENQVANFMTSKSEKVRNELKSYVKIVKATSWKDTNFWTVVKTVEKTHDRLMKFMKEFQKILEIPVNCAMNFIPNKGSVVQDLKAIAGRLDALYISELTSENNENRGYFLKSKKICKKIIENSKYPDLLEVLNETVDSVNEDIDILNKSEIDRTVEKEKQKSQAKHLLQQKRKLIADLFKTLSRIGLSYRKGIVDAKKENFSVTFASQQPLNVDQLFSGLPEKCLADEELIRAWDGCENTFFNTIAKQSQLKLALQKPHQDLGPQMCDRVRGFGYHLLDTNLNQKSELIRATNDLHKLRVYESILTKLSSATFEYGEHLNDLKDKFVEVLFASIYCLEQFAIILDCCPENEKDILLPTPAVKITSSEETCLLSVTKTTPLWTETCGLVEKNLHTLRAIKTRFFDDIVSDAKIEKICDKLISAKQYDMILASSCDLRLISDDLSSIQLRFGSKEIEQPNTICQALYDIQIMIDDLLEGVESFKSEERVHSNDEEATNRCKKLEQDLVHTTRISIQEYYKNASKKSVEEQEDTERLKEGHLKELLIKSLQEDVNKLNMVKVRRQARALINFLMTNVSTLSVPSRTALLKTLLPIMNQYCLLAEHTVTELVTTFKITTNLSSSVLSLFVELTTNGFRIPAELLEEEKEGQSSKDQGGMGLEDGEGVKDVSDQIESEDQLEGAQKPGEENKEDDRECKEEDNGIEMSEDFGGKSQNLEQKEGDESDDEGDDDLDKEMGETGEEADALDQEVWGSDSEDEEGNDEAEENEKSGEGQGEQFGEKQMGAKDEHSKEYEQEENDKESPVEDKQKEINEMDDQKQDDDQIDPYHGKQDPLPEPEALDLPDDLQLDDGEAKDDGPEEENPFDIDAMKELMPPKEDIAEEEENQGQDKDNNDDKPDENEPDEADDEVGTKKDEEKADDAADEDTEKTNEVDDGGEKDENKLGDEPKQEDDINKEEAEPSEDNPSQVAAEAAASAEKGSKDQVKQTDEKIEEEGEKHEQDTSGVEQQGIGQADEPQDDTADGHSSAKAEGAQTRDRGSQEQKRKLRPGESDANRSLAETHEPFKKRLKTIEASAEENEEAEDADVDSEKNDDESSLYQHIKEAEKGTAETVDAATKEQAEKQPTIEEDKEGEAPTEDDKMDLDESEDEKLAEDVPQQQSDKMKQSKKDRSKPDKDGVEVPDPDMQSTEIKIDGEFVETMNVERGLESTFYTLEEEADEDQQLLTLEYIESLRNKAQDHLSTWTQTSALEEATAAWEMFSAITSNLSQELSEQLRLVLEPTQASKLKGDFRTGRRINMRKVIPYIASQFRKDKIWLRRTKPSKREYQIILAIDNSCSMSDNHSKELAFESVALVSKALSLIEAGELGVISFGESTRVLHPLGEPFSSQTGAKLVRDFTFDEDKTKFAKAVEEANSLFLARGNKATHASKTAQLLVIVSDGRNVYGEGASPVKSAIRAAKQSGIFIVFLIVENPECKTSILDMRNFKGIVDNKAVFQSYVENFPFPFYIILRDINKLPAVLSEALQQWFELVTNAAD